MSTSSLEDLFDKYYNQTATAEEKEQLFRMIRESKDDQLLVLITEAGKNLSMEGHAVANHDVTGHKASGQTGNSYPEMAAEKMLNHILDTTRVKKEDEDQKEKGEKSEKQSGERRVEEESEKLGGERRILETNIKKFVPGWWKYAAAAVLLIAVAGFIYYRNSNNSEIAAIAPHPSLTNEIAPGGNKAILTLADGKQIILDNAADGSLSTQGNSKVIKLNDGQLSYETSGNTHAIAFNTISTPNGGQYQLILSDGSKVWLNAASSLRYPTSFPGSDRTVELTGEGYFEIAHNPAKPFHVMVNDTRVEVLGTQFNVNAYSDEPSLTTTLLEGKLKVGNHGSLSVLKPGQQAIISQPGKIRISDHADLEEAIAWKNGKFIFNGNRIQSIMRQLARWYDVKVEYKDNLPDDEFVGAIRRSENISALLHTLEKTKTVSFKISGKVVTVLPYKN